jgi:hypothetical protein
MVVSEDRLATLVHAPLEWTVAGQSYGTSHDRATDQSAMASEREVSGQSAVAIRERTQPDVTMLTSGIWCPGAAGGTSRCDRHKLSCAAGYDRENGSGGTFVLLI